MKIGIISDSHGQAGRLETAIDTLVSNGVEVIFHCGDVDDENCLALLADSPVAIYLTAGNMDRYIRGLDQYCEQNGINFGRHSVELKLPDGRFIAALHGHNEQLFSELLASEGFSYIFYGHSHQKDDRHIGSTRIINPGALERAIALTVALLDSDTDQLEYFEI